MKSGSLIVRSHNPFRRLLAPAVVVGSLLGIWGGFEVGQIQGGYNRLEVTEERTQLEADISSLQKENKKLGEQITMLERTQLIDKEAYDGVRDNLKLLQEEILELREEVDFYRGIVSPSERLAGLNIQAFKIDPAGEQGLYHYSMVMTQVLKNDRVVRGAVKVFLQGVQDGEPLNLPFKDISPNKSVNSAFRFRYFQKMEGDIRLPDGFVPRTVQVELTPKGRKKISKSFPWQVE